MEDRNIPAYERAKVREDEAWVARRHAAVALADAVLHGWSPRPLDVLVEEYREAVDKTTHEGILRSLARGFE